MAKRLEHEWIIELQPSFKGGRKKTQLFGDKLPPAKKIDEI